MHRVTKSQRVTLHAFQGAVWYNRNLFWSLNFLLIHHKRLTRMGMLTYMKDDVLRYSLPFHRCQMLIEFISRMLLFFNIFTNGNASTIFLCNLLKRHSCYYLDMSIMILLLQSTCLKIWVYPCNNHVNLVMKKFKNIF